jgi:hypothetical protein
MNRNVRGTLASVVTLALASGAAADTVTVNVGTDPIDIDWSTATIEDLPGPDGLISFSEAMIATNNTPGHDTIGFAIPKEGWLLQFLFPNRAVIWTTNSFFWRASDQVTIDGTTQTAFTGDTNPDGAEVVIYGDDVYLNADGCTVLGLDSSWLTFSGSNGVARENTGATNLTFGGGSGALIEENTGSTLKIDRSNDNIVVGNTFERVRVLGAVGLGQPVTDNRLGGPNPEDRNYFTGLGTWNSEGLPSGFSVQIFDSEGTIVENNSIGTTPDGMAQGSLAANMGIRIEGENYDLTIRDNRIAGVLGHGQGPHHAGQLFGWAVYIIGSGSGIDIVGNTIGLDANGDPVLGSVTGVDVESFGFAGVTDITVGGTGPSQGNVIAGHIFRAVTVGRVVPQVRISGNSIYANGQLGIELVDESSQYGVSLNDPLDADTGGNGLQNFPEIASASTNGATVQIVGTLHSSPSDEFSLDFFASPTCDATGFGEGEMYLGSTTVFTNGAGDASFDVILSAAVPEGWVATSTATLEPLGATSEFSACVVIEVGNTTATPVVSAGASGIRLLPSTPNPFRLDTAIHYTLPAAVDVHLAVYDAAGRLVRVLESARRPAGSHRVVWDGRSGDGRRVAGGVYFYRLRAGGEALTRRAILTR